MTGTPHPNGLKAWASCSRAFSPLWGRGIGGVRGGGFSHAHLTGRKKTPPIAFATGGEISAQSGAFGLSVSGLATPPAGNQTERTEAEKQPGRGLGDDFNLGQTGPSEWGAWVAPARGIRVAV